MPFELPKLKYDFTALEPYMDAQTVEIHYTKHHQTYVTNLNKALEKYPDFSGWEIEKLLGDLEKLPEDIKTVVRNNGGGFHNHNLYWSTMKTASDTKLEGALLDAIITSFGGFEEFKTLMTQTALTRFGSGWAWLVHNSKKLEVYSTPNQDSPLMTKHTPLLGLDVWEHAYYLKYQNKRADYIENWWNLVDWEEVAKLYSKI